MSCPFSKPEVPKDPEEAARLQQLQAAAAQWQQVQQQRASLQYQALMQQHEKLQNILEKIPTADSAACKPTGKVWFILTVKVLLVNVKGLKKAY